MSEQIQVDKHIYAVYNKDGRFKTKPLSQPDYGRVLVLQGVELPESYEVYFSNTSNNGKAKCQIGNADGVVIPDEYVVSGRTIYAWYFLHADGTSGQNEFMVIIPNNAYGVHDDAEPTPVQQSAIDEAILALQQALYEAGVTVSHYPQVGQDGYWYTWDTANGEWVSTGVKAQGEQGETGQTGPAGADGHDGTDGQDGFSPVASVAKSGDTATITITDKTGTTTATVTDGADGQNGADGYSPTASVSKTGSTSTITITDKNGTTTAEVVDGTNGTNGTNGTDGYSPTATVSKTGTTTTITITDKNGTTTAEVVDGTTPTVPVTDVQVNGTSVLSDGVANIPLNVVENVSGSTPTITATADVQYVCGECSTLTVTLPESGCVDVTFESGSTATVLTVTPPTGYTKEWANGFDETSLDANTTYEINIKMVGTKCLGVAASWT